MELTAIEQDRQHVTTATGERKYRIRTAVTSKGELPYPQIFLFEVNDPIDVSLDTFIRIATISDLEEYKPSRSDALHLGSMYYLDAEFTVDFDNLNAAVQAKSQIYSRIDGLTKDWYTYSTKFYGVDDPSSHPTVAPEFEQQLVDDYTAARTTRQTAETDLATAETAVTTAKDASDTQQSIVDIYEKETDFCVKWTEFWGTPPTTQDPAYPANQVLLNDFCAAASSGYASARALKQVKDADYNAAVQAKITADATLAKAQTDEAAALAAVLAVCPTFDPTSV